ncbi:EAL domain, c-di-GMP-specific phosphodiesterase class I (or its enzymatically inactive variant) [Pseudomonas reinekei]|jgi:sensor c-di-GMP phosphodiesterase-like protein|uniref:cyclic-guanylate-specific phosphodiesterase n=1 Tax=Pseudomonas reinekei TaxID=395598 RepID=A0A1H0UWP7_PSERE|nr:cyclic diguanylate phosphodiesterase [Pseudomonas reinekei]KAB0488523.1 cyclic diguanylate phosphodiesterase [Pseudomonas reinekei]OLU06016.1 cyclic diguanylate phosphodiesterase [Pseudomonas reinekei]SDP70553.1 EAL domain, c-di-GMP-specific phosphodiesterase class I (or its enzymatically inactive variant) [Pseudomonas reinekei]
MPLKTKPRKRRLKVAVTLLSGLLPVLLGSFILYMQAGRALVQHAQETAEEAIRQFELMLDNTAQAAHELLPLAGQSCLDVNLALREQVTRRPFVRSTNLMWDDTIYCSSLFGDYHEKVASGGYAGGRLLLMKGNPVTPDTALLVYRIEDGKRGALATLDGYHLSNVLRLIGRHTLLILQVGNNWLTADGHVQEGTLPDFSVAQSMLKSTRYDFSVAAGFPDGETWRYMTNEYPTLFSLLIFFGVISGAIGHVLQKRSNSPTLEMQRALDAVEFVPYFQAVVHGDSKKLSGIEVLMRWNHPKEGLVRPDLFIPFAEHSGLIVPMTRSLMQQTATLLGPLSGSFTEPFHIGINITASHCQNLDLIQDCRQFLGAFAPGSIHLVLELTERELFEPTELTHQLFDQLHELGVMFAIDDFGTGHSSLGYLRQFNVDFLKIDQSFVAMIGIDTPSSHILDTIIQLARKLELSMVAEGVETQEQSDYLTAHNVNFQQGFLFGRPMPGAEFISALSDH